MSDLYLKKLNKLGKYTKEKIKGYYESVKAISDPYNTKYNYQKSFFLNKDMEILKIREQDKNYQQIIKSYVENQLINIQLNPRITLTTDTDNFITSITIDISKLIMAEVSAWKTGDYVSEEDIERPFSKNQPREQRFSKEQEKTSPFSQKKSYERGEYQSPFSKPKPSNEPSQEHKFKGSDSGFENMERLRAIYQEETGRKPVLRGKRTQHYRDWVKKKQREEAISGKTPKPLPPSPPPPPYKTRKDGTEIRFCPSCGAELEPNSESDYCDLCGAKIQKIQFRMNLINFLTNLFSIESISDEKAQIIHEVLKEIHHIYSTYEINIDIDDQIDLSALLSFLEDETNDQSEEIQLLKDIISIYAQYDDSIIWTQTDLDRMNQLDQDLIELGQDPTWAGGIIYESENYSPYLNFTGRESPFSKKSESYVPEREKKIRAERQTEEQYVKSLREQYTEETGKPPVIRGKKTKHYKNWLIKKKQQERIDEYKEDEELREEERQMREQRLIEQKKDQELKTKEREQEQRQKLESKKQESAFKKQSKDFKKKEKKERSFSKNTPSNFLLNKAYGKKISVEIEGMITFFLNYNKYNIELNIYIDFKTPEVLDAQKKFIDHILRISQNFAQKLKVLVQP